MTIPARTPSDPPDLSSNFVQPVLTPEHRAFLKRLQPSTTPAHEVLEAFFELREGTPEERGRAIDVLGRLLDPGNGYMNLAWHIALDWTGAAHDRYGPVDLVKSTAEEIQKALERPSGMDVLDRGWPWLVRTSARRARSQAGLNGGSGMKAITERGVKDAQKLMADLAPVDDEEWPSDSFLDDGLQEEDASPDDNLPDGESSQPVNDEDAGEDHEPESEEDADPGEAVCADDTHDRYSFANDMARGLSKLHEQSSDLTWLIDFLDAYRERRLAELSDPQRQMILNAILGDMRMTRDGEIVPELAELGLTLERANRYKREERSHLLGVIRRAAEQSGTVSDEFLLLILERLRRR